MQTERGLALGQSHQLVALEAGGRRYELLSRGNVRPVIEKIRRDYKARHFAELLIDDAEVSRLFLHHWRQLSLLPDISIPLIVDTDQAPTAVDVLGKEAKEATGRTGVAFESIIQSAAPVIQRKLESLIARMKAQGVDPEKVNQETFAIQFLSLLGIFSGASPLSGLIRLMKPFEDYVADEIGDFASELLSAIKLGVRDAGNERRSRLIEESGLPLDRYRATIARMLSDGYLRVVLSVLWCEGHPSLPVSLVTVGDSTQAGVTCSVCNKELIRCNFLLPTVHSMVLVRQYPGALQYLLPWMLEQQGMAWTTNVYVDGVAGDTEKDIVFRSNGVRGITVVECKSDYTDSPARTVNQKIRDHLVQLSRAVTSYRDLGVEVGMAILATNYETTSERRQSVSGWIASDADLESLRGLPFKLVGPGSLAGWWKPPD